MLTNGIILAINDRDTLRPLGLKFKPFANRLHDTKYHKQCSKKIGSQATWLVGKQVPCTSVASMLSGTCLATTFITR
jgi:hypothetical protein